MKRLVIVGGLLFSLVLAQSATITYSPVQGDTARYSYVMTTDMKLEQFEMVGKNVTDAQREQFKKQFEQAGKTQTTMDMREVVEKVEANQRTVRQSITMGIKASGSTIQLGLEAVSLYKSNGSIELKTFKIDPTKTSKTMQAAFAKSLDSLKNLFQQSSILGFYNKPLSATPLEVLLDIPTPALAAQFDLKYKMRIQYVLKGRTTQGGYLLGIRSKLEPIEKALQKNGMNMSLRLSAADAKGEISILPDGRLEKINQPSDMTLVSSVQGSGQSLSYRARIKTSTIGQIVR